MARTNTNSGGPSSVVESLNGLTGPVTLSAGQNMIITETGNDILFSANFTQQGKYMISGGAVWSGSGLTYDVSYLSYFFDGLKSASETQVTLAVSDPTFNRIDAIVVDEAGTVTVITGDASASPVEPPIPEDQLQVQFILVAAGSISPTVATEIIYEDDPTTNWTTSTYTTGAATGTIDFAGTNSPFQGINDIEASTDARLGARFVRSTSFDPYLYTMYQVRVKFTGTAVATNKALNIRFENSAGTLVGSTVNLFSYGLQRGVLNTWQLVVVPITAFGALPATVKGMKMIMAGGTVGVVRQWDVDYMLLTDGSTPYTNIPTIAFYANGTGFATQSGVDLVAGTGVTITPYNDVTNQRARYTIDASGGGVSDGDYGDITVSGTGSIWTVDNSAITYAKIQNLAQYYGIGRIVAGTGVTTAVPILSIDTTDHNIFSGAIGAGVSLTATSGIRNNLLGFEAGSTLTTGNTNNFLGYQAGKGPTTGVTNSNFLGYQAGLNATSANNSNFLGRQAGSGATGASFAQFFGRSAGINATGAQYGVFIGDNAGNAASGSSSGVFIGQNAGYQATTAPYSIFIGTSAGYQATGATTATFIGYAAGYTASNADYANMIGRGAGNAATNAFYSQFMGFQAGYNATNAANAIFIGSNAGFGDTVDNTVSGTSILIGNNTSTGGFSNSIAIGKSATNTAANEMQIGSASSKINTVVVNGVGGIQVPVGTTGERVAVQGMIRYNTTTSKFEGYDGAVWQDFY